MQYLTFDEYQEMGGTVKAADFLRTEYKKRMIVDNATFMRFSTLEKYEHPEQLKMLMFELVEKSISQDDSNVQAHSVSTGGLSESITYKADGDVDLDLINMYLANVEIDGVYVLYRGAQ